MVVNDDSVTLQQTRRLHTRRQQAGFYKCAMHLGQVVNENCSQTRASPTRSIDIE